MVGMIVWWATLLTFLNGIFFMRYVWERRRRAYVFKARQVERQLTARGRLRRRHPQHFR